MGRVAFVNSKHGNSIAACVDGEEVLQESHKYGS